MKKNRECTPSRGKQVGTEASVGCRIARSENEMLALKSRYPGSLVVRLLFLTLFGVIIAVPQLRAADQDDFDAYTVRVDAFWFNARPAGVFSGNRGDGFFNLQKDVHFNTYTTFTGFVDS